LADGGRRRRFAHSVPAWADPESESGTRSGQHT